MIKKQVKIMLRAFNGECDAAVARVTWNNATRMIERIRKSCEVINAWALSFMSRFLMNTCNFASQN